MESSLIPTEGIILRLDPGNISTKAGETASNTDPTRPGNWDGAFNENNLGTTVDVFFYKNSAGDDTNSTFNDSFEVNSLGYVQIPISQDKLIAIFGGDYNGALAKVLVVANFNGPVPIDHSRAYTVNELRALSLATADWSVFPQTSFVMLSNNGSTTNPSPLVPIEITREKTDSPASATVQMQRVAAKISFRMTVADQIKVVNVRHDSNGDVIGRELEDWTPVISSMTAYMQYAIKTADLGGSLKAAPNYLPTSLIASVPANHDSLYMYAERSFYATTDTIHRKRIPLLRLDDTFDPPKEVYGDPTKTPFTVYQVGIGNGAGPFYTYPVTWTPGDAGEPFIKLIIPWNNGTTTKKYYYKVPFTKMPLESNHWYEITLDVEILGGESADPVPLEASYQVVSWEQGGIVDVETTIESPRYLSVPTTEFIMYNIDELTIPITSSHDVQIVGYQVKPAAPNKSTRTEGYAFTSGDREATASWIGTNPRVYNPFTNTLYTIDNATTVGTVNYTKTNYNATNMDGAPVPSNGSASSWFPTARITRDAVVFEHTLKNDTSTSDYDISSYFIRFRIQHKDDASYYKDVIIEQRPAIMISAEFNSGGTNSGGNVYVNNGSSSGDNASLGSRGQSNSSGNNTNDYMYIIETSVLPASSTSVLGDPRARVGDNLTTVNGDNWNNWSADTRYVGRTGNATRRLSSNYYPAIMDESGDRFIAPKFRIASSHGKTTPVTYANAVRRCASYQEDGYPAGRWRLPTADECQYIAKLNTDGKIPRLLGNKTGTGTTKYWCNNGYISVYNGTSTNAPELNTGKTGSNYVRCVYDEWFWENTTYETVPKGEFTWGDQAREDVKKKTN